MSLSIISANRLRDGMTVWMKSDGQWAEQVSAAAVFDAATLAPALQAAQQPQTVVDIHEVEATQDAAGAPLPVAWREQIRATGPSVRPDLPVSTWGATGAILPPLPSATSTSPYAGIYRYDDYDRQFLRDRAAQFGAQVARRLAGELSEDEFKPLRLMNGLYLQLHAYMLRVALPYGIVNAAQLRQLAYVARHYDGATAISPPARTSSSTGCGWKTPRPFSPCWPKRHPRHPDQRQLRAQRHHRRIRRRRRR